MFYKVVLVSAVKQCKSAISICFPFLLSLPTPPGHHRAPGGLPVLYSSIPLAIYFIHGRVDMAMLLTTFKMVCLPLF